MAGGKDPYRGLDKLMAVLRGIRGASYHTQLTEIYPTLVLPEDDIASMPYGCVYFDDSSRCGYDGDWGTTLTFVMTPQISFFLPETVITEIRSGASIAAAKLFGDIGKAFLLDIEDGDALGGLVDDFSIGPFSPVAGALPGTYAEFAGSARLTVITGPDGLGP